MATKNNVEEPIPDPGNLQCYGLVLMLLKLERDALLNGYYQITHPWRKSAVL
jgi:hypothetical protein